MQSVESIAEQVLLKNLPDHSLICAYRQTKFPAASAYNGAS